MLGFYRFVTKYGGVAIGFYLQKRLKSGKEDEVRFAERLGQASQSRPDEPLIWLHAASVGEVQSAMVVVSHLLEKYSDLHILITTGTRTSAALVEKNKQKRIIHQYYPVDTPDYTERFLNHWRPDLILWMESELWPNMLQKISVRNIPAILLNARLSDKSYSRWSWFSKSVKTLLSTFDLILTQTKSDQERYQDLGARHVQISDNLKYSAEPLPYDDEDLNALKKALKARRLLLFASTHKGEEELACRMQISLRENFGDLLTIIVPRHPERRNDIRNICTDLGLQVSQRSKDAPVTEETQIYLADTLGELGLFYRLAPLALIGRSFSEDGGGGHNPIEAAQLGCAVLHGPNVQYLQDIYNSMRMAGACTRLQDEGELRASVSRLLSDEEHLKACQNQALEFAQSKTKVIDTVMDYLEPYLADLSDAKMKKAS